MYRSERARGTLLRRVDDSKLNEHLNRIHQAQWGDEVAAVCVDDIAVGFTSDTEVYDKDRALVVICSEGVGWEPVHSGLVSIPVTYVKNTFYGFSIEIGFSVLLSCLTEETVDLADHIRVFGDRLENNFFIWKQKCL